MAAQNMFVRSGVASGVTLSVVKLVDRRRSGTDAVMEEGCFQREMEAALYGNGFAQQSGAVYRLLQRSGVSSHTLSLKTMYESSHGSRLELMLVLVAPKTALVLCRPGSLRSSSYPPPGVTLSV